MKAMTMKTGEITRQLVIFKLAGEEYGCDIDRVKEVLKMVKITPLPETHDFMEGIINLRGEVIPVLDLRKRVGLKMEQLLDNSSIVIVEAAECTVGLIVDAVTEVLNIEEKNIQESTGGQGGNKAKLIEGVGKAGERLLLILNLNEVIASEAQSGFEEINTDFDKVIDEATNAA